MSGRILTGLIGVALTILIFLTGLSGSARENKMPPLVGGYLFNNGWYDTAVADAYIKTKSYDDADKFARAAIARNLADARAVRIVGLVKEAEGDSAAAEKWFSKGGALGWRDSQTQVKLFEYALRRNDFPAALDHGDALLRRQVAYDKLTAAFVLAAQDETLSKQLVTKLAAGPGWRPAFFSNKAAVSDQYRGGVERTAILLQNTSAPVTRDELDRFMVSLERSGKIGNGLSFWQKLFPDDGAVLAAGGKVMLNWPTGNNFQKPSPLDWRFVDNPNAVPAIYGETDGKPARLEIDVMDSAVGIMASRNIVLPAGQISLQLSNNVDAKNLAAIGWSISCGGDTEKTPLTLNAGKAQWTATIPENCASHRLHLEMQNIQGGDKIIGLDSVIITSLP